MQSNHTKDGNEVSSHKVGIGLIVKMARLNELRELPFIDAVALST